MGGLKHDVLKKQDERRPKRILAKRLPKFYCILTEDYRREKKQNKTTKKTRLYSFPTSSCRSQNGVINIYLHINELLLLKCILKVGINPR